MEATQKSPTSETLRSSLAALSASASNRQRPKSCPSNKVHGYPKARVHAMLSELEDEEKIQNVPAPFPQRQPDPQATTVPVPNPPIPAPQGKPRTTAVSETAA